MLCSRFVEVCARERRTDTASSTRRLHRGTALTIFGWLWDSLGCYYSWKSNDEPELDWEVSTSFCAAAFSDCCYGGQCAEAWIGQTSNEWNRYRTVTVRNAPELVAPALIWCSFAWKVYEARRETDHVFASLHFAGWGDIVVLCNGPPNWTNLLRAVPFWHVLNQYHLGIGVWLNQDDCLMYSS